MSRKLLLNRGEECTVLPLARFDAKEKGLQRIIENNMESLLDVTFVGSEKRMGKQGRIDSVGIRDDRLVLVEYKEDDGKKDEFAKHIVNQGLHYAVAARNNLDELNEYVLHESGRKIDPTLAPMIMLVARDFHTFDKSMLEAFNHQQVVRLKEYDLFGEGADRYFYIGDTPTPRDFRERRIPSHHLKLDDMLNPDDGFDKQLLDHPEETAAFLERVVKKLYSHVEDPLKRKFCRISDGEVTLLEEQPIKDAGCIRKSIKKNIESIFDATYVCSDMKVPLRGVRDIDMVCITPDGRLVIIDYGFREGMSVPDALAKMAWVSNNHPTIQGFVHQHSDKIINWGYEIDLIMISSSFTDAEKHLRDIDHPNIRSRLIRAVQFSSVEDNLILLDSEVTKKDLETYVGAMPAYDIHDYISRLKGEPAQNALRYILGEVRDMSDEISLIPNKYGYGVKADKVFCQIRVTRGDTFNFKINMGDDFNDLRGICSGKTGDGYARVKISGSDSPEDRNQTIRYVLGYIRHAFNLDTGREQENARRNKNGR
ncbi:MAG: hypothetical protein V1729_01005 [Candidatus Woesearchaeota archaeon]